jgi:hypothetical protein
MPQVQHLVQQQQNPRVRRRTHRAL